MKTTPRRHQQKEFDEAHELQVRAMLWAMRSGKSKVIVDTAFDRYEAGEIEGVLIEAPNGVHSNWIRREVPKHAWHSRWRGLAWSSSMSDDPDYLDEVRKLLTGTPLKFFAVNAEALTVERCQKAVKAFLKHCHYKVLFVGDEAHGFGRPGARKTMRARGHAAKSSMRRILTGTSILNSPLHAYSQFELLKKGALGFDTYEDFQEHFAEYRREKSRGGRVYPVLDHYKNLDELRDRIGRLSSVVLREEADMPPLLNVERPVQLSDKQVAAYDRMVDEWQAELDDGYVMDVLEGGARMMKLQQILGGWVNDEAGRPVNIDDKPPRLDAMWEQVEGSDKAIIWCRFQEDVRRVTERLKKEGAKYVEYHGKVKAPDRIRALEVFQSRPRVHLVGTAGAGGQGLDLSAGDAIIWYGHEHGNAIMRAQGMERATEAGGKTITNVDIFSPGTIEETVILPGFADKQEISDRVVGRDLRDALMQRVRQ